MLDFCAVFHPELLLLLLLLPLPLPLPLPLLLLLLLLLLLQSLIFSSYIVCKQQI